MRFAFSEEQCYVVSACCGGRQSELPSVGAEQNTFQRSERIAAFTRTRGGSAFGGGNRNGVADSTTGKAGRDPRIRDKSVGGHRHRRGGEDSAPRPAKGLTARIGPKRPFCAATACGRRLSLSPLREPRWQNMSGIATLCLVEVREMPRTKQQGRLRCALGG